MSTERTMLGYGVGLRVPHFARALDEGLDVDWVEAISENFFGDGGRPRRVLERLRRDMPIALHGVGMGIGSATPVAQDYVDRLRALIERVQPAWVSDHLCWGRAEGHHTHDLLPLPHTEEALDHVVREVSRVQESLGRRLVLENVSSYVTYRHQTLDEWTFLAQVAERADALLLLDINNIIVNAHNHGFNPLDYIAGVPAERVIQLHLANHTKRDRYCFDDHRGPVPPEVWSLYEAALAAFGPVSTLIEWDSEIPPWEVLREQQREAKARAEAILGGRDDAS